MKPIIELDEWLSLSPHSDAILVDARGGAGAREKYLQGHLRGAIFVDVETQLSEKKASPADGGRHPLPDPQQFVELLARLGIFPGREVVVYDDKAGANAACRFWWMLQGLGHSPVRVLNGGLTYAVSQGVTLQTGWVDPVPIDPDEIHYPNADWQSATVSLSRLVQDLQQERCLLVDVREAYRYLGESEPIDSVAGHIPGAINIPYLKNLLEDGRFAEGAELRERYLPVLAGRDGREVVFHCGSGVSACHTLLALQLAELPPAKLYVGSWSEWSRNDLPIATDATDS